MITMHQAELSALEPTRQLIKRQMEEFEKNNTVKAISFGFSKEAEQEKQKRGKKLNAKESSRQFGNRMFEIKQNERINREAKKNASK